MSGSTAHVPTPDDGHLTSVHPAGAGPVSGSTGPPRPPETADPLRKPEGTNAPGGAGPALDADTAEQYSLGVITSAVAEARTPRW